MRAFLANSWLALLLTAVVGYLLGSINWAIIVTKCFSRKDIRTVGSGNAGATNVLRSQGMLPAVLTTVGDVAKGVLAVLIGGWLLVHLRLDGAAPGSDLPEELRSFSLNADRLIGRYFGRHQPDGVAGVYRGGLRSADLHAGAGAVGGSHLQRSGGLLHGADRSDQRHRHLEA